jgi:hypothetical protein
VWVGTIELFSFLQIYYYYLALVLPQVVALLGYNPLMHFVYFLALCPHLVVAKLQPGKRFSKNCHCLLEDYTSHFYFFYLCCPLK